MLGIVLIYFIGRYFYRLAEEYNKNKWMFAIIGVLSYYVGTFVGGIILGVLDGIFNIGMDWDNSLILGLLALPFGVTMVYLFHFLLKRHWEKTTIKPVDEIETIGKSIEE